MGEKKRVPSVRFLGVLKQPDSDTDTAPELDEIWPSDDPDGAEPPVDAAYFLDPDPEPEPVFPSSGFGLSALLAEDRIPAVRRPTRPVPARTAHGFGTGPDIMAKSAPMNVPTWRHARREDDAEDDGSGGGRGYGNDDDEEEEEEMVPPHVIVARSHVTTFSVFEGVGRTLKGRDLRRVRNAVFQKTGFLD
ncbi:uncharacterized protein M6B38_249330 [Iris pallida]|uniref:Senescence regulator n=1 Tax=Iris pallida TaxID=29817 RepID=A0AAX6IJM4_IRIPA|nr:uncharacterized protein M6B38_200325 [Iris pallida]KAJ6853459.1 uncharacterized protein M6B38_249330 [Iris pallida]